MHRGYIKLWRSSVDSKLYFMEPFSKWQAWQDLLLLANHKDSTAVIRGIPVEIKRGQVLAGEEFLADRWKWSRGKVRRFLQYLEGKTVQQIVQQKNNIITTITIVNWDCYQGDSTTDDTADSTPNSTTNGQQTDTLKNDKNVKNTSTPPISPTGAIFQYFGTHYQNLTDKTAAILNDAIEEYSEVWVMDALKEGVERDACNWKYAEKILKRWKQDGRGNNHKPAGRIPTKYTDPAELEAAE